MEVTALLQKLLGLVSQPAQSGTGKPGLLDWFGKLTQAWQKPAPTATSATPAANSSTPVQPVPAASTAQSGSSDAGAALQTLLDLLAKGKNM